MLQELVEVHDDEHIQRNGGTLGRGELLTDQIQSIAPFALADLALNGIALPLVISKLLLLLSHQLWVILGASKARSTQANAMTLAEGPI